MIYFCYIVFIWGCFAGLVGLYHGIVKDNTSVLQQLIVSVIPNMIALGYLLWCQS